MQVEHMGRVVWVSPTAAITASDIESAQPQIRSNGDTVIAVVFTDAGAKKFSELTRAQLMKLVAMVVDGKVLWAPTVNQAQQGKENVLTGNLPTGLTQEEVDRIMAILR
jgi:preprotein translocase subunit SecD